MKKIIPQSYLKRVYPDDFVLNCACTGIVDYTPSLTEFPFGLDKEIIYGVGFNRMIKLYQPDSLLEFVNSHNSYDIFKEISKLDVLPHTNTNAFKLVYGVKKRGSTNKENLNFNIKDFRKDEKLNPFNETESLEKILNCNPELTQRFKKELEGAIVSYMHKYNTRPSRDVNESAKLLSNHYQNLMPAKYL